MKALAVTALLLLGANSVSQAEELSLVGTWSGERERIGRDNGYGAGLTTLVISDQKGRTFTGHLTRSYETGEVREPFWGAFSPGGRMIVAGDEEGHFAFDLVDKDTLDYCYSEASPAPKAVCARLLRQK
jgi:hypothetical protein